MTTTFFFCLEFWTIVIVLAGASLWLIPNKEFIGKEVI